MHEGYIHQGKKKLIKAKQTNKRYICITGRGLIDSVSLLLQLVQWSFCQFGT